MGVVGFGTLVGLAVEIGIFVDEEGVLEGGISIVITVSSFVVSSVFGIVVDCSSVSILLFVVKFCSSVSLVSFVVSLGGISVFGVLSVQLTRDTHNRITKRKEKNDLNNECVISISPLIRN